MYNLPSWFADYIRQDDVVFGYVGDRKLLLAALTERSLGRKLWDAVFSHLDIAALSKALAGIPDLSSPKEDTLGSKIVAALTAADLQRTLSELLARQQKKLRSEGRYFEQVTRVAYGKPAVFATRFQDLQDKLTTIRGHLIHRDVIGQYNKLAAVPVLQSKSQWFLADSPPHFQAASENATGEYVLLAEEQGFTKTFGDYLPFCPDVGWYPNVRVTGFFEASKPPLATLPNLRIGLVEYRAPFALAAKAAALVNFANKEIARPNYLADRAESILFAYLGPILFRGSATAPNSAPPDLRTALKRHAGLLGNDMPAALQTFYAAL